VHQYNTSQVELILTNPSIENYEHFFYGHSAQYGLVGVHDRRIWLVLDDPSIAHQLRTVFAPKISLAVFDLSTFNNYNKNLIDNSVCLNWSVPVDEYVAQGIIKKIVNPSFDDTFTSTGEHKLTNTVPVFNFLSESSQLQLQQQIMFFYHVICNVFTKNDRSVKNYPVTDADINFDQTINSIFSTELTLLDIEQQMILAANKQLGSDNLTVRQRSRAFCILQLFGKVYG
jgi:hypothetical protein